MSKIDMCKIDLILLLTVPGHFLTIFINILFNRICNDKHWFVI